MFVRLGPLSWCVWRVIAGSTDGYSFGLMATLHVPGERYRGALSETDASCVTFPESGGTSQD